MLQNRRFEYINLEKVNGSYVATLLNNLGSIIIEGYGLCPLEAINSLDTN